MELLKRFKALRCLRLLEHVGECRRVAAIMDRDTLLIEETALPRPLSLRHSVLLSILPISTFCLMAYPQILLPQVVRQGVAHLHLEYRTRASDFLNSASS